MCQLYQLIVTTQLLLSGGWVIPVHSLTRDITVSRPLSHSLPAQRVSMFGSQADGRCTSISNNICNGTSVLNDGIIPALSDSPSSQWAAQLFTMTRSGTEDIILTIEVDGVTHDRVELAVFNSPDRGIYAPQVQVYAANTDGVSLFLVANQSLTSTSCDYLLNFCVEFPSATLTHYNLIFPYRSNSNSIFLGEVTFMNYNEDVVCDLPELITSPVTLPSPIVTTESTTTESLCSCTIPIDQNRTVSESLTITRSMITDRTLYNSCTVTALTVGVVSAVITALLVAGISMAIHIAVYQCLYKPRLKSAVAQGGTDQRDDVTGARGGDAIVYDVVDERVGTALEMKQNEAYGLARSK